mmetsp:Transcript_47772/g.133179  ORF Transcript_47772/g.133179 Transcript_47772/m.133179 type:complete len:218 (-) Transcript_47772:463-1116(-)
MARRSPPPLVDPPRYRRLRGRSSNPSTRCRNTPGSTSSTRHRRRIHGGRPRWPRAPRHAARAPYRPQGPANSSVAQGTHGGFYRRGWQTNHAWCSQNRRQSGQRALRAKVRRTPRTWQRTRTEARSSTAHRTAAGDRPRPLLRGTRGPGAATVSTSQRPDGGAPPRRCSRRRGGRRGRPRRARDGGRRCIHRDRSSARRQVPESRRRVWRGALRATR